VRGECQANALGQPEKFPVKTRKIKRSSEVLWLLLAQNKQGQVWLEKRPASGIWASLYSLPVFDSEESLRTAVFGNASSSESKAKDKAKAKAKAQDISKVSVEILPTFKHVLTHKDLHCHVVKVALSKGPSSSEAGAWWSEEDWQILGLPTPIRHLLSNSL
jgi:A/G-specific adenine glycosylase